MNEKILCAAIWYKELPLIKGDISSCRPDNCDIGIVFCGHRHHNCLHSMVALTGKYQSQAGKEIQGFLTSRNRFVNRTEALEIALRENQVLDLNEIRGKQLYSEDLY